MIEKKKFPISYRRMYFQVGVKDLERAKKFYEDIFGFEVAWYAGPEVGWCEFHLPGSNANLGLNASRKAEHTGADFSVLTIDVKDLEETKKYLDSKGLETTEIMGTLGTMGMMVAIMWTRTTTPSPGGGVPCQTTNSIGRLLHAPRRRPVRVGGPSHMP